MLRGDHGLPDPAVHLGIGLNFDPGEISAPRNAARGDCAATSRAIRTPCRSVGKSPGADKKQVTILTVSYGSDERNSTSPRLSGWNRPAGAEAVGVRLLSSGEPQCGLGGAPRNMNSMFGVANSGRVLMKACRLPGTTVAGPVPKNGRAAC